MRVVQKVLRDLGFESTSRPKTVGTMIDKLRRDSRSTLSRMQDVAGIRVTAPTTLSEQDRVVGRIHACAEHNAWRPRVKDRRAQPSAGYRAVHVIVTVDECPIEIQVRTTLQDLWAQAFEDLGEVLGRGIRYGEPPQVPPGSLLTAENARELVALTQSQSSGIAGLEERLGHMEQWRMQAAQQPSNQQLQALVSEFERKCHQLQEVITQNLALIRSFKDMVP
jgi:ppGpp synthetase/RelA/SpoT-type nucleotidyltranferase